jgi:N-methylhydantoinase A/oxoprolinase/acetone carboxylase beta subunit
VYFEGHGLQSTAVFRPPDIAPGGSVAGPAVLDLVGTTAVIGPGQTGRVDGHGHITIELEDAP